jgi:hypothetical protein
MNPEFVSDFAVVLRRNHIRYVIVGGAAVWRYYPSESQDVDALLVARDYARAVRILDKDPSVESFSEEEGRMATGHFHSRFRLVRFDLLDPSAFSGARSGDAFFEYVARHGSELSNEGRVATVPVVWYMRLAIEGDAWTAQVGKILRDVRAGAPWALKARVLRIARHFGLAPLVSERWRMVEEGGRRTGLLQRT